MSLAICYFVVNEDEYKNYDNIFILYSTVQTNV